MEPDQRPAGSGKKPLFTILAILGGLGVLMIVVCGGCSIWLFKSIATDIPPAQAAADAFFDDLKADRVDAAYAATSSAFKSTESPEKFREFVKRFDTLKTQTSRSFTNSMVHHGTGGKQVNLKMTLHSPNNAMSCTLIMVDENGQWKVQRLNVP